MIWLTHHKELSELAKTYKTLTPSQKLGRNYILQVVKSREMFINLWGPPGVGKTFLAHSLHHCSDLTYFLNQTHYNVPVDDDTIVAIDNAPYTRQEARRLYDKIRWGKQDYTGPKRIILITRKPIDDAVYHIELKLTETDIVHMENLIRERFGELDFESINQYVKQRSGLWWYVKNLTKWIE